MQKIKGKIRGIVLISITVAAVYMVFCSVGVIDTPEWDLNYLPLQICMFVVGMAWIVLFGAANGLFDDYDDEEDDEWDM